MKLTRLAKRRASKLLRIIGNWSLACIFFIQFAFEATAGQGWHDELPCIERGTTRNITVLEEIVVVVYLGL